MTVGIKYPDISSLYYLALYKRTRRHRLYIQTDVGLISRLTLWNCSIIQSGLNVNDLDKIVIHSVMIDTNETFNYFTVIDLAYIK